MIFISRTEKEFSSGVSHKGYIVTEIDATNNTTIIKSNCKLKLFIYPFTKFTFFIMNLQ